MVKQKGIDLAGLVVQAKVDLYKRRNKGYSLFAVEICIYFPSLTELGHHLYKKSPTTKNKFDRLLQDEDFSGLNYTDVTGGPFNEEAIAKYGEATFDRMKEHMTGITVSKDYDGNIRIPYSDLNYAFRKATGQKTNPEMWD